MSHAHLRRLALIALASLVVPAAVTLGDAPPAWAKDSFAAGEAVEVESRGHWYPAKVVEVRADGFHVRFDGYDSSYDDLVDDARIRKPKDGSTGAKVGALAAAASKEALGTSLPVGGGKAAKPPPLNRSGVQITPTAGATSSSTGPTASSAPSSTTTRESTPTSAPAPASASLSVKPANPNFPDLVFRIGDPVEVLEDGKWYPGVISNLEYDHKPFSVNMELFETDRWWPPAEVRPVASFEYEKRPSAGSIGTDGAWKVGDNVETQYFWGSSWYWRDAVVVSIDRDNYYLHVPEGTGTSGEYHVWRRADRIRNPGATKPGWDEQPDPNGLVAAFKADVAAAGCASTRWPFLWHYDHGFERGVYGAPLYHLNATDVKAALDTYACLAPIAQKHPDLPFGMTGAKGAANVPFPVQRAFLVDHKALMRTAMEREAANILLATAIAETGVDPEYVISTHVARVNGFEEAKEEITNKYPQITEILPLVGATIPWPWDEMRVRYDAGLVVFNDYLKTTNPSLKAIDGYRLDFVYSDPKIEGLAKAEAAKGFPGATVIASASGHADLEVIADSLGIPEYRYKYAALLLKGGGYRSCVKAVYRYREDYDRGARAYTKGYIDRMGLDPWSVDEYTVCP